MSPRARTVCVFLFAFAVTLTSSMATAHAQATYWSTRQLLADFFPQSARVSYRKVALTPELRARVARRLGYSPARESYTFFFAETNGKIDGYTLVDDELGQHQPITFATQLSPDGVVKRHEIVVYREPRGDEVRDERFRRQFVGKRSSDRIGHNEDIVAISGATISSRAMAVGVRRAVILLEELILNSANTKVAASGGSKAAP